MSENDNIKKGINRRQFIKFSAASMAVVAAGSVAGCGNDSDSTSETPDPSSPETPETSVPKSTLPSANAWKFGIISDTQWTKDDDGENPASCAVDIINALNSSFVEHGVKFVLHVGDLTDDGRNTFTANNTKTGLTYTYSVADAMGIRARYAQELYNNGIGFFPMRGNHDDSQSAAIEFNNYFPQTTTGEHNVTSVQTAAYAAQNPDTSYLPDIKRTKTTSFDMGSSFSSPSTALNGLSYSFDYDNVRFVILDTFTGTDGTVYPVTSQQSWINSVLSSRQTGTHAFVLSHKGLMTQDHTDIIFGSNPSATTPGQDEFITSLSNNKVKYYINGHDHMHDRSYVYTHDGATAKVTQLVTASDSSKFYTPANPSNDQTYCSGLRQKLISQELYGIGYYIVTVDGEHVTFEYYSAPSYSADSITTTPALRFAKKETFGYSLKGTDFLIAYGASYNTVDLTSTGGTRAKIIDGRNANVASDLAGRRFNVEVNAGFYSADDATSSDILSLRGMDYTMGSTVTDVFTLSMSYTDTSITDADINDQTFGLAKLNDNGVWENAVIANSGGKAEFVKGEWTDGYTLGTWGVDTTSKTVWAVINSNGFFSAVKGI
ncbi:metallophosphoesterase [Seleniivibrio woodruffii]|uniref:metallophosphoesterase family protein n=1 Tax=Seleniivibrio woodruffii TaxID=1078050 RepID=UPI0026EC4DBB|nr:metallophosphoesterase [Seleniivibrio woodruffii]